MVAKYFTSAITLREQQGLALYNNDACIFVLLIIESDSLFLQARESGIHTQEWRQQTHWSLVGALLGFGCHTRTVFEKYAGDIFIRRKM